MKTKADLIKSSDVKMEIFVPNKRIPIDATFLDNVNPIVNEYRILYSGKKNIYTSVYKYTKEISPENVIVDKIFLDFDYDEDLKFFHDVRKVVKYLAEARYIFKIRFSGKGFHVFIELKNQQLKNPKSAIRKWVQDMHEKTNTDSDHAVIGDLRRVCRMLGSMNLKTHLYCIPIEYSELMNFTYESICEMAKEVKDDEVPDDVYYIGGEFLDISEFDNEDKPKTISGNININNIKVQDSYPQCVENMLKNPELGYWGRGQLIVYLRDEGYSFEEILMILQSVLSESKFHHCTIEEGQPAYLYYNREDLLFASCQTLKENGFCNSNDCPGCYLYL